MARACFDILQSQENSREGRRSPQTSVDVTPAGPAWLRGFRKDRQTAEQGQRSRATQAEGFARVRMETSGGVDSAERICDNVAE
jgi:hypothetical protein